MFRSSSIEQADTEIFIQYEFYKCDGKSGGDANVPTLQVADVKCIKSVSGSKRL